MTLAQAEQLTGGGFSYPSKMPCPAYSIPATLCKTGSKLRAVAGSVCAKCYALRNRYLFPAVRAALAKRLRSMRNPEWAEAVAFLINAEGNRFFRWHDSGDLQTVAHLRQIVRVCNLTPDVRHWLPTREYGIVSKFIELGGTIPDNLTVRLSAHMVDGPAPVELARRLGLVTSTVMTSGASCPSREQGNKCAACRACWDKGTENVAYEKH
jgi:hypothetical protein